MSRLQLPLFDDVACAPTLRDIADAVRLAGLDGLPDARRRSDAARYQEIQVRSALASVSGMPFRWALNPYRGCTHACEYCYARKYQRHLELGTGDDFSSVILVKANLPRLLARELQRPTWSRELVAVGTATDAYQPIEGHYRLTRQCLEALTDASTPFSIVTKGPMVVRDLDVLTRATRQAGCQVFMSVPSVDEEAWSRLEPGTAPPAQRLRALRQLQDAGVSVGVLMMPLVPGITTSHEQIHRTIQAIHEAGLPISGTAVTRLDPGVKEHFLEFLAREYPALVSVYEQLYPGTRVEAAMASEVRATVKAATREVIGPRRESGARSAGHDYP
jgi:DNA repair photolyase